MHAGTPVAASRFFIIPGAQVVHFDGRSYEGRPEWAARLHPLMHAAIYIRRREIFGLGWARLDSLVALLDHLALYCGLAIVQRLRPAPAQREMMTVYKILSAVNVPVNVRLLVRGASHAHRTNQEFREWLAEAAKEG